MMSSNYILIIEYFSRFIEVIKLKSITSRAIIEALKSVFSCYGIPEVIMRDNGPPMSLRYLQRCSSVAIPAPLPPGTGPGINLFGSGIKN